jgi:hypothetical protein
MNLRSKAEYNVPPEPPQSSPALETGRQKDHPALLDVLVVWPVIHLTDSGCYTLG